MVSGNRSFKSLLGSLAVYLILLAFVTWPGILSPSRLASPPRGDRGANVWNLWWSVHAVQTGTDPRWTPLLFHPLGCLLTYHSLSLTNGLLLAPLTLTVGPGAAYGFAFFFWSLLTGLGGMIWSRRWLQRTGEQWLVGFVLVFSAYRFAHLDHLNLFTTAGIPWCFWAFDRLREDNRFRNSLLCALFWVLTAFSCWYYGIVVGIYAVCRLAGALYREGADSSRLTWGMPFVAVACAVGAYVWIPVSAGVVQPDAISLPTAVFWSFSVDGLVWPLWLYPPGIEPEFRIHPGIVFLLLVVVEIVRGAKNERQVTCLVWIAGLYALFALGPFLKLAGDVTPVFLPAYLFRFLPGLSHIKVHARFLYPAVICLAPVAVRGLGWIAERIAAENPSLSRTTSFRAAILIAVAFFWFEQGLPPFSPWPVSQDEIWEPDTGVIETLQQAEGSVLELPFLPSAQVGLHLARQTYHGKPLVIGEVSRLQAYRHSFLQQFPSLSMLTMMVTDSGIWSEEAIEAAAQAFMRDQEQLGIGVILVSERYCVADAQRRLSLFVEKLDEDERPTVVYSASN